MQELERWKLHDLVALLPILIQLSLLLFSTGILLLIFPLHLPSAIVCSLAIVPVVGFYVFTTGVSVVNNYAPFSSPVSRLLARSVAVLYILIDHTAQRIDSAISFHNRPPLHTPGHQKGTGTSDEITQPLPSYNRVAERAQSHHPDSVEKSNMVPRSHSGIDPQAQVHVLERLVMTTAEAVENIPIFLDLLDQPVKDPTLRPFNVETWKALLHITLRLLGDQFTIPVSAACTLARTMMICYSHETPDMQLFLALQHHLGSRDAGDQRTRMPRNVLFSSYLPYWLGYSTSHNLWRTIAFLEPSDAADAELLWMVNTFHRTMHFKKLNFWDDRLDSYIGFFAAVLTYVSSTEQSRRSNVPLTAAAIYALHTIRSALDHGGINSIDGLYILPGNVSTSEPVLLTFCQVDGIDALDLWSEECIQFAKDILQWDWPTYWLNDFRLSLIAALYIDSTKQAHARSAFADFDKRKRIADIKFQFSEAYDDGNLAIYSYMALAEKLLSWDPDPLAVLRVVIENTLLEYSTLQLSGLQILEIALKHVHKRAASSSGWVKIEGYCLSITLPGDRTLSAYVSIDPWILLHLDTLFPPQPYLLPEAVKKLEWSDTSAKVYIASARLDLYDSLATAERDGATGPKPDPELLRVFLWSRDHDICRRAFRWCLDLVPISQSDTPGDANGTRMFIPEAMGVEWVAHSVSVLCQGHYWERGRSLELMLSNLVPKWTILPPSWCHDFASALLFTVVHPLDTDALPAYRCLAKPYKYMSPNEPQEFLSFLVTLLELTKSSLTCDSIISLENWLAQLPKYLDAQSQMESILATRKHQLVEEILGLFAELPMASEWREENLELFAELPMADEWAEEILGFFAELPMAGEWMD